MTNKSRDIDRQIEWVWHHIEEMKLSEFKMHIHGIINYEPFHALEAEKKVGVLRDALKEILEIEPESDSGFLMEAAVRLAKTALEQTK